VFDLFKRKPAPEPAAAAEPPLSVASPEDVAPGDAKRSWSERLKTGLGLSRA
jgi:hypothetical protein